MRKRSCSVGWPAKVRCRARLRRPAHGVPLGRIASELAKGCGKRGRVSGRHGDATFPIGNHFAAARALRADDRQAAGRSLQ